jgi:hypothetical protein
MMPQGGAKSGAVCEQAERPAQKGTAVDADLIAVIRAWPNLPETIRAGILALVWASD